MNARTFLFCMMTSLFASVSFAQLNPAPSPPPYLMNRPNPFNTGAYAFAFVDHATDARIGDRIVIDLRVDAGKDNLGNVQGGMFRFRIPFAKWVEIEANLVSDAWQISSDTARLYNIQQKQTRPDADLNFKTKIRILEEKPNLPAIGFMATLKTAAGDFNRTHRFTDSAGYEFSVMASKDILDSEETLIRKIRILSELAFICWDTNLSQQNDAFKASAAVQLNGKTTSFKMSFLGFYGWQNPTADYVSTLQAEATKQLPHHFQVYGQANLGLSRAAIPYLIGGGVRYTLDAPKKKKRRFPIQ